MLARGRRAPIIEGMKIAVIQFRPEFGRPEENLEAIFRLAGERRADLLVLPELCTTGYQFTGRAEARRLAEDLDGPSLRRLAGLAGGCGGVVVAGFAERQGEDLFNSAAVVGADGVLGVYRKTHLFYREKEFFQPGDSGFSVFDIGGVKLGVMICFDWFFPEAARSLALAGAQVIAHPANLVLPWCQRAMPIRALENRVFTVTANRVGSEQRWPGEPLLFTGASLVAAPDGRVLAQGPEEGEVVLEAEIDPGQARDKRVTRLNDVLADRRPELYFLGG